MVRFSISAKPLASAIADFIRITGWQISFSTEAVRGKTSQAVQGSMTPESALRELLSGTGVVAVTRAPGSAALVSASRSDIGGLDAGADVLDTVYVSDAGAEVGWDGKEDSVYSTPGTVGYISRETIDHFRGTTPGDILGSEAGVFSGSNRNSGGLDVNIRGLQGQGRVPVTVDGTINSTSVYHGYQGVGNRSFIDPDFIGGIGIEQGPVTGADGSGAIGGIVRMRTLLPDDIVEPGKNFGVRLKAELGTNTTPVVSETMSNQIGTEQHKRPGLFSPASGSASVVLATKGDRLDLLAGYARRKTGNYFAGTSGEDDMVLAYEPGKEVYNTSQDTKSGLLKGIIRLGADDDHKLELTYSKYVSEYGENYPSTVYNPGGNLYQGLLSTSDLDRYSARYAWTPDNPLVNFKANVWQTYLKEVAASGSTSVGDQKNTDTFGLDIANTSRFDGVFGAFAVQYGGAVLSEQTGPDESWSSIPGRQGSRYEQSVFTRADYAPTDWLSLNAGMRYQKFKVKGDLGYPYNLYYPATSSKMDAFGYSGGLTLEPIEGLQFFGSYKKAARLPSLMESSAGFLLVTDPDLMPEVAHTWEAGVNYDRQGLFNTSDTLGLKLSYFNNRVSDYIARSWSTPAYPYRMLIHNIDEATFEGINASAQYTSGSFKASLSAAYYTRVEYCRTFDNCKNSSLANDYSTNQVPPKFSASLTLSKGFLNDRLTLGGRLTYVGEKAAEAEIPDSGANPYIAEVPWRPYTLIDVFSSYKLNDYTTLDLRVENLTDQYYVEPLSLGLIPAPGRTIWFGLTSTFSPDGPATDGDPSAFQDGSQTRAGYDWSGAHLGLHASAMAGTSGLYDRILSQNGTPVASNDVNLGTFDGRMAGVRAGYNFQFNNHLVVGVEADYNFTDANFRSKLFTGDSSKSESSLNWLATARLKAGVSFGRFLAYGTGGVAYGSVDHSFSYDNAPTNYSFKDTADAPGFVIGGGLEWALTDRFSVNAEYLSASLESQLLRPAQTRSNGNTFDFETRMDMDLDILRVGLNFNF
ncbi:TonB-dependent receptor domain-containing protein [Roseibium aggregatum]|uniref:TonB-dependent receptor n=1 Tax=Roseibium aggregatum TaxID=187304 RepID=A0A939J160_9HYPH|nr:TonB-dependent receptor [Roseibium aggregatum]MBN9670003.1 TonB-dependent receptor [Roseibium aggregatum]